MPTDRSLNRVKKISRSRFGQQTLHIAKEEISLLKTGPPARKSSVDFTKSAFSAFFQPFPEYGPGSGQLLTGYHCFRSTNL
jgi:hypothetical protein